MHTANINLYFPSAQKKEAVDPAKAEEASTEENQDESENKPALDQEAKDVKDKAEVSCLNCQNTSK